MKPSGPSDESAQISLQFKKKTNGPVGVRDLWALQGPPSEGTKGKEANWQEMEGFKSGKEPTQDRTETESGIRAIDNSGGKDDGDSQQMVAPKGPPNLKTAEPTWGHEPDKHKTHCTCRKAHWGKCWANFG